MPRIIRQILRQANTIYGLANATNRITTNKPTIGVVNDYVLKVGDIGKLINLTPTGSHSAVGSNVYLPNSTFNEGHTVRIYNSSTTASLRVIPNSSVILHTASTGANAFTSNTITGSLTGGYFPARNVAPLGVATILCVDANTFVIHGPGVTSTLG